MPELVIINENINNVRISYEEALRAHVLLARIISSYSFMTMDLVAQFIVTILLIKFKMHYDYKMWYLGGQFVTNLSLLYIYRKFCLAKKELFNNTVPINVCTARLKDLQRLHAKFYFLYLAWTLFEIYKDKYIHLYISISQICQLSILIAVIKIFILKYLSVVKNSFVHYLLTAEVSFCIIPFLFDFDINAFFFALLNSPVNTLLIFLGIMVSFMLVSYIHGDKDLRSKFMLIKVLIVIAVTCAYASKFKQDVFAKIALKI